MFMRWVRRALLVLALATVAAVAGAAPAHASSGPVLDSLLVSAGPTYGADGHGYPPGGRVLVVVDDLSTGQSAVATGETTALGPHRVCQWLGGWYACWMDLGGEFSWQGPGHGGSCADVLVFTAYDESNWSNSASLIYAAGCASP